MSKKTQWKIIRTWLKSRVNEDASIEDTVYGRTLFIDDTINRDTKRESSRVERLSRPWKICFVGLPYFCVESLMESFIGTRT
jgi:hypothetical protein